MFRLLSKTDHRSFVACRITRKRWCAEGECHRFLSSIDKERNTTANTSRTIVQSLGDFSPYAHSAGIFLGILGAATAGAAAIYGKFSYLNSEVQKERELRQEQVQKERELRQGQVQKERELRQEQAQRVQAEVQKERELRQEQVQKERELRQEQAQRFQAEVQRVQAEVQRVRAEMASEVEKARQETATRFLLYGYAEEFQRYQKTAGVYKDANDEENQWHAGDDNESATREETK
jgi:vacuolar-type H+-ATPase subunit I/STV1